MTDDDLKTEVLERLHSGPDGYRALVREISTAHPGVASRRLELALLTAASDMDATIRRAGSSTNEARTARRLALLLSMDIDRASQEGPVTLGDLLALWRDRDDFFLRL